MADLDQALLDELRTTKWELKRALAAIEQKDIALAEIRDMFNVEPKSPVQDVIVRVAEVIATSTNHYSKARKASQTLIEVLGSVGSEHIDETAERAAKAIKAYKRRPGGNALASLKSELKGLTERLTESNAEQAEQEAQAYTLQQAITDFFDGCCIEWLPGIAEIEPGFAAYDMEQNPISDHLSAAMTDLRDALHQSVVYTDGRSHLRLVK